ncbi:hypothetical protein ABZ942_38550 [Nocardia sp. NPDC046473]|uniref:hypothetical protein n=1 Tax=Nocardia sp. NPDC046473 TaxID=3155733 RepID=UPI0033DF620E
MGRPIRIGIALAALGLAAGCGAEGAFVHTCSPTASADSNVLPYNVVLRIAQTQCVIHEQTGVSCDTGDGHGFTVSDTAYTLK